MGRLTTHVLDTALGKPAKGLKITFWSAGNVPAHLSTHYTNDDGRVDAPILEGENFEPGEYELWFFAGEYLKSTGQNLPDPLFLDLIPIRFGMSEPDGHYHVPLLLSPFGYSTYRGS